jgi:tyrosinase
MTLRCRKNQSTLTSLEKSRFVAALLTLKAGGGYDQFVMDHMGAMADAHRGPAFLPWHRQYLLRLEEALRAIDSSVTLPYWDWTVDNSPASSIWDPSFMGGDGRPSDGWVTTGPFAHSSGNWNLVHDGPALRRRFGLSVPTLPASNDLISALAQTVYDVSPYNTSSSSGFRNHLEGWISGPQLHNRVHVWVGGSMGPMSSPNDPVFFLHHCFVDKCWADWQTMHPGATYLPVSGAAPGHNLGDNMQPWAGRGDMVTPASVLDHHALGYAYDNESVCAPKLKFRDDLPKLKFRDDIPTLKFRDDIATFKFQDDITTLKFRDDGGTLKFRDDGGTLKAMDDVKHPSHDLLLETSRSELPPGALAGQAVPFILSTPHHSMAWAQGDPETFQAAVQELEEQMTQVSAVINEKESSQLHGEPSQDEVEELQQLRAGLENLLLQYRQLTEP